MCAVPTKDIERPVLLLTERLFAVWRQDGSPIDMMLSASLGLLCSFICLNKERDRAKSARGFGESMPSILKSWIAEYGSDDVHDGSLPPSSSDESLSNALPLTRKLAAAMEYERDGEVIRVAMYALLCRILLTGWGQDHGMGIARELGKVLPQLVKVWERRGTHWGLIASSNSRRPSRRNR
jgi:hypothetical protein